MNRGDPWARQATPFLIHWRRSAVALYKRDIAIKKKTPGTLVAIDYGARLIQSIDRELKRRGDWA